MTKVALIGAGKMGISHLAILGAHPDVEIVGVVDNSKIVTDVLQKYSGFRCFDDYKKLLTFTRPDAVIVAVPTKMHAPIVMDLLQRGIHVFVEKPFCLDADDGPELIRIAGQKKLVNQVGYHNKSIGTFAEVKRIIESGYLGNLQHFSAELNGPVVVKKKQGTWRSKPEEGGGCLMDYAAHVIDLINDLISPVANIHGALLKTFYSGSVEDGVFALLETENNISGVMSVNWSDETYRKMATTFTIIGTNGKMIADATELKVYFKTNYTPVSYSNGWNHRHINDFSEDVDFYLRGEEYSAQIDYFIKAVQGQVPNSINTFETAWKTDKVISQIKQHSN